MFARAGALVLLALASSACILDFTIPGDTAGDDDDDPSHACGVNQTCSIDCKGGTCRPACATNSTCNVQCSGGTCNTACAENATCNISCAGGTCNVQCGTNATCNVNCAGGTCNCSGPGCHR